MKFKYEKVKETYISEYVGKITTFTNNTTAKRVHVERIYQNDPRIQVKFFGENSLWKRVPDKIFDISDAIEWFLKNEIS